LDDDLKLEVFEKRGELNCSSCFYVLSYHNETVTKIGDSRKKVKVCPCLLVKTVTKSSKSHKKVKVCHRLLAKTVIKSSESREKVKVCPCLLVVKPSQKSEISVKK